MSEGIIVSPKAHEHVTTPSEEIAAAFGWLVLGDTQRAKKHLSTAYELTRSPGDPPLMGNPDPEHSQR